MDFLEAIQARIVIGDGAMGTLLHARGVSREACLEELCLSRPGKVGDIHREYLAAGAEVIRTHSFQANARALARHGLEGRVSELNWLAARIARDAAKGTEAWVAASIGPTGMGVEGRSAIEEQMGALLDGGVDLVMLETFTDLEELLTAIEVKHTMHHCPVVACLARVESSDGREFGMLRDAGADVIGLNCAGDPLQVAQLLQSLHTDLPLAAFPSAGLPVERNGGLAYPLDAAAFGRAAAALPEYGVRFLGGCCGTTPDYIRALATSAAAATLASR
jgi:homocysteine S-methyltransferase